MSSLFIQIIQLILFQVFLIVLLQIWSKKSSDHYYHVSLINAIRGNGNKFVTSHPNLISEKYFAYPQFYHWLLSFLSPVIVEKYYKLFAIVISLLQLILFLVFAYTVYPFIQTDTSLEQFMFLSGLVFIFTPFSYASWNAKNTGISARGFGLFFGQIYLYFITWYYLFDNIIFFLAAFLMGFIIILSSQFSMQFMIFSAPLFALFCKNPFFLLIPVFALLMFYLIMPEIARNFIKGQINHKTLYYRYLAEKFILSARYSIWRDFVWDFWVKARTDIKKSIPYIYYNPLVGCIIGFPFFTLFSLYLFLDTRVQRLVFSDKNILYLAIPIVVSFSIFLLTSFRKTRFLGEPERYMEFCIPQISVFGAILFCYSNSVVYVVLGFSFLSVIWQFILPYLLVKYGRKDQLSETMNKLPEIFCRMDESNPKTMRIFSNNVEIIKELQVGLWKVLNINLTSPYTGSFHFSDIFLDQYKSIAPGVILPLIKQFNIGWFILDTNILPKYNDILEDDDILLKEEVVVDSCRIFRVCSKN
jgi:hypothetical protein